MKWIMNRTEPFVDGYVMHAAKCNKDTCKTYHDVSMQYLNYLKNNFMPEKTNITVASDNYDDIDSMKEGEQLLRYWNITPLFQVSIGTSVYGNHERFWG